MARPKKVVDEVAGVGMPGPKVAFPKEKILIQALKRSEFNVWLIGETPLIVHAWSQKAKLELLKKHMQQISIREPKDPEEHFLRSIYRMEDGHYGLPVVAIKEAMATAASDLEGVFKSQIYRNIFVSGRRGFQHAAFADILSPIELAELFSPNPPRIREDMVRLSGMQRTPDLRYRAEFDPWAIRLKIGFIDHFVSMDSILNLLSHAGFRVGLAEWRQEKGGNSGAYHVAEQHEQAMCERWAQMKQKEPVPIDTTAWLRSIQPEKSEKTGETRTVFADTGSRRRQPKATPEQAATNQLLGRYDEPSRRGRKGADPVAATIGAAAERAQKRAQKANGQQ